MIPIPIFQVGVTVRSLASGGSRIRNAQTDPPQISNGGYNFSLWIPEEGGVSSFQQVLDWQSQYNARLPLTVSPQGNLVF